MNSPDPQVNTHSIMDAPEPYKGANSNDVPFPLVEKGQESSVSSPADSQTTSSSQKTSSDKLSALPVSTSTPNTTRLRRSPVINTSSHTRGFRRSLDASASLPSFSTADLDSPPLSNVWNTLNSHPPAGVTLPRVGGPGDESPAKQRVSFDSDRGSGPTTARQPLARVTRGSDPTMPSPALRSSAYVSHLESQKDAGDSSKLGSRSRSHSRSRAGSPLRIFQQWSAGLHRGHRSVAEEPFVPIDPFKFRTHLWFPRLSSLVTENAHSDPEQGCTACVPAESSFKNVRFFVSDTLPRELYLNLLLRLPAMYFSRVARIFEDAEVSRPDIQRMIDAGGGGGAFMVQSASTFDSIDMREVPAYQPGAFSPGTAAGIGLTAHVGASASVAHMPLPFPDEWTPPLVSPALIRFKHSWEAFIDSLVREWKTLNVVSALLLSAILTMFQIPSAEGDPVTRTAALLSLVCALMSLSYGCMYIVRFGTMRSMYRASKWAEEARKTDTLIWWNVWVLLAMPSVWLAWSMVLFVVSILSFLWRTGSVLDPDERPRLGAHAALGPRIAVTTVFVLGMIYFALIVKTLRSYGAHVKGGGYRKGRSAGAPQTSQARAREIEIAMDRRGRERERTVSGATRTRREEMPGGRGDGIRREDSRLDKELRKKNSLRKMTGLGLGLEMDATIEKHETFSQ